MTSIMSFLIETLMGVTPPLWRYSCLEMMYSLTRDQKKPWSRREVTDQMRFGLTYHIITLESNMERVSSLGVKLKCPPVDVTSPQVICIVVAGHARHNGPLNKYMSFWWTVYNKQVTFHGETWRDVPTFAFWPKWRVSVSSAYSPSHNVTVGVFAKWSSEGKTVTNEFWRGITGAMGTSLCKLQSIYCFWRKTLLMSFTEK